MLFFRVDDLGPQREATASGQAGFAECRENYVAFAAINSFTARYA
jgi:hypothetical protein